MPVSAGSAMRDVSFGGGGDPCCLEDPAIGGERDVILMECRGDRWQKGVFYATKAWQMGMGMWKQ